MREYFEKWFSVEALPVAPLTWDLEGLIRGNVEISAGVKAEFRQPVTVLGLLPSIVLLGTGGAVVPTGDDIAVEINSNQQKYWTTFQSVRANQGPGANFVTLNAISLRQRFLVIELTNASPTLSIRYKWKNWDASFAAAPRYQDALVTLSMFAFYPEERKGVVQVND